MTIVGATSRVVVEGRLEETKALGLCGTKAEVDVANKSKRAEVIKMRIVLKCERSVYDREV